MGVILDLAIVFIILFSAWRGYKQGAVNGVIGIVALILAIAAGSITAGGYAENFSSMPEPFVSGMVDSALTKVLNWEDTDRDEPPRILLTDEEKQDVRTVAHAVYIELGFLEPVADALAQEVETAAPEGMSQNLATDITEKACARMVRVLVIFIGFALVAIIFAAIGSVFDLSFGIPGYEKANAIAGATLGTFKGLLIVLMISGIFRYTGLIFAPEKLNATWFAKLFTETNFIANILGI